jgi:hypothetical protein
MHVKIKYPYNVLRTVLFNELNILYEWPDITPAGCMFKNGSRNLQKSKNEPKNRKNFVYPYDFLLLISVF